MTSIQIDRTDGLSSSTAIKGPCKAATTANITLSGEQTIDGVACVTGDRVLVKDQTSAVDNGVWKVSTGVWSRAKDFSSNRDAKQGTMVNVVSGTVGAGWWQVSTSDPITIGSTSIAFSQPVQPHDADLDSWAAITRAAGFDAFTATPSSANLKALLTDETGSGAVVFADSPTLTTPVAKTSISVGDSGGSSVLTFKSDVLSTGIAGVEGQNFFLYKEELAANPAVAPFRVQRNVNYNTGDPAQSFPTIWALTSVQSGVVDHHYSILGALENGSTSGENVAGYFQGKRSVDGQTWALVAEARDTSGSANPTKALTGIEVDIFANGTDDNNQRIGVEVVVGKDNQAGTACTAIYGFRVTPYNSDASQGSVKKAFAGEGNIVDGLDFHSATISHAALWLADSQKILFDTAGTRSLSYASSSFDYKVSGISVFSVADNGDVSSAGRVTGTAFLLSTTNSAPVDGVFLSAAHTLGFSVNSTQKVWVDANGVGIGAATVASVPFQITDASNAQLRLTSTADIRMGATSTGGIVGSYSAHDVIMFRNSAEAARFDATGMTLASGKVLKVGTNQVVAARDTGWTVMTGTPDKATAYATGTVTLPQLAGRVAQIQASLTTHGLIGV